MKIYKVVVGMLGTNCYIVASEKNNAFIIDPGDNSEKIKDVILKHNLKVLFIVNTHGHVDHIKENAVFGLPVYVHEMDNAMVSDPKENLTSAFLGSFDPVVPARLLKDADTVELDELSFRVLHTPGHTLGGICLYGGGVLFSGDTLFCAGVGRTDFPGGSYKLLSESLKNLSKLPPDTKVYPGHGQGTTIGRELSA